MDQEIKFCTTTDGVSIAYATLGSGPPLVYVCGWPGNLAIEWEHHFAREFLQSFATEFTLVRYDMRNTGLSQQTGEDINLDALVLDLEAVVDHRGLQQFALMSLGLLAGPVAFTYAGTHAGRVSRVVALGPLSRKDLVATVAPLCGPERLSQRASRPRAGTADPGLGTPWENDPQGKPDRPAFPPRRRRFRGLRPFPEGGGGPVSARRGRPAAPGA